MRVVRGVLCCALLLFESLLQAAATSRSGDDVVVLLFRTESVQQLHIESKGAALQLCSTCAPQKGNVSMDLRRQGSAMLDGANHVLRTVSVQGSATVETAGHHRAQVAGRWLIDVNGDRLRVRVQISRERYVEAVLASEAEPNEPTESLRALAIIARSFAAAAANRHEAGSLCDTTHCQALRLEPVRQAMHDAVWSTSGETLWYGNRQVPAYFSQHCGGYTGSASAAWGGAPAPWLSAHADAWCSRVPSQWHAALPERDVRRAMQDEGMAVPGEILQVVPLARDSSGRVQQLRLRFAGSTQTVQAATLRFAVDRSLGWNQIRSDRYQVQRVGDRLVFQGSGYGHGVGLCQAGAAAMARAGRSYREILDAYFPGTKVGVLAGDSGWTDVPADGVTLRTTNPNSTLKADVAFAAADARARWGRPVKEAPTVTLFPTTEAFRQATGMPGWTLAVTQGSSIAVQPLDVVTRNGGARLLLRHELLHNLIEAEASPAAPLWLREGWVAVLNGEPCGEASAQVAADQVDAALSTAASLKESQQAHRAACVLTQRLLHEQGQEAAYQLLKRR